jgi:PAS domain S-box-containing protein
LTEISEQRNVHTQQYSQHLEELVKERPQRLRETEEMLRALSDATPNGAVLVDMAGNIVECYGGTLRVHHYTSKNELIGKSSLILVAPKDRERAASNIRSARE